MHRTELVENVRGVLVNAGFYVSELLSFRPVGFDLVARRDNHLLIIKVLTNIDALPEDLANGLQRLAYVLNASSLIVGERRGTGELEKNVVYDRFGIKAISLDTLREHLLDGVPLHVYAGPGGLYVKLDHNKIMEIRKQLQLSLGAFARCLRVSRRAVQRYEEDMNATVEVAARIESFFEREVTIPIDILKEDYDPSEKMDFFLSEIRHSAVNDSFQWEIFSILKKVGYTVIPMNRCPFEAVSKNENKTLLTCINKYNKQLVKKAKIVGSISKITERNP